jgi:hypothetical protein
MGWGDEGILGGEVCKNKGNNEREMRREMICGFV